MQVLVHLAGELPLDETSSSLAWISGSTGVMVDSEALSLFFIQQTK